VYAALIKSTRLIDATILPVGTTSCKSTDGHLPRWNMTMAAASWGHEKIALQKLNRNKSGCAGKRIPTRTRLVPGSGLRADPSPMAGTTLVPAFFSDSSSSSRLGTWTLPLTPE
jgi:hypothetical protein